MMNEASFMGRYFYDLLLDLSPEHQPILYKGFMGAVQAPSCGLAKASSPVSKVLESDGGREVNLYSLILTSLDSWWFLLVFADLH